MRKKVFVTLIAAITLVHFGLWQWCWQATMDHIEFYPPMPSQSLPSYAAEGIDPVPGKADAGVLLSLPLGIPFACLLWNSARPLALGVGLLNSMVWGVALASGFLYLEHAVWRRQHSVLRRTQRT